MPYVFSDTLPRQVRLRDSADLLCELITRNVLVTDNILRAIATELLARFDASGFKRLLAVALDRDSPTERRILALLAIKHVPEAPDVDSYRDVLFLASDDDGAVAAVAADVLMALRPPLDIEQVIA